jgi:hypothetical protein
VPLRGSVLSNNESACSWRIYSEVGEDVGLCPLIARLQTYSVSGPWLGGMSIAAGRPPMRREDVMRFMLTFTIRPKERGEAISRFKAAGGQLPEGVKLLSRWTAADLSGVFDLPPLRKLFSTASTQSGHRRCEELVEGLRPFVPLTVLRRVLCEGVGGK